MGQEKQKRTERLLEIPIRVIGFNQATGEFTEETHTTVVSQASAHIVLKQPVVAGDAIRLINLENLSEADFRVVGPTKLSGSEVAEWGVECVEPGRNIWGIELPPTPSAEGSEASAALECRACRQQGSWPVTLMEVEVLDSTGVVVRECSQCAKPTYWTYAEVSRRPREFPPSEPVAPPARGAIAKKDTEKRAYKRLTTKLPILIRNQKGEQEIAKTENISKGGFAVSLAMDLAVGDTVVVVCPYTADGQNIEQKAEVRHRAAFSFGEMRLYGFCYLR